MQHLKEAGHYYKPNGRPAYTVAKANGKGRRKTTVADCRRLGLYPSVTTILSVLNKPGLNSWREKLIVEHTDDTEREPGEPTEKYIQRIFAKHRKITSRAADRGSRIHGMIESRVKGKAFYELEGDDLIWESVRDSLEGFAHISEWVAEKAAVSNAPKYAGKCDLHCPSAKVVVDIKTKEFGTEGADKIRGYPDQGMQLAAYAFGLDLDWGYDSEPRLINLFVSSTTPGLVIPYEHKRPSSLLVAFKALAYYWWALRGLDDPDDIECALEDLENEAEEAAELHGEVEGAA